MRWTVTGRRVVVLTLPLLAMSAAPGSSHSASFGELSSGPAAPAPYPNGQYAVVPSPYAGAYPGMAGPYSMRPNPSCPPNCQAMPIQPRGNAEGQLSMPSTQAQTFVPDYQVNPRAYLPIGPHGDSPHAQVQLWTFGQLNSTTDPFNPWGLSTPYMFVPWSTPLSGWTNSQTWNWWRERSGALPRNW